MSRRTLDYYADRDERRLTHRIFGLGCLWLLLLGAFVATIIWDIVMLVKSLF